MKPDYASFERGYRQLRDSGQDWNTPLQLADTLSGISRYLERPGVPKTGRVLELGCGAGDLSLWLARRGFEVFGVDISPTAIGWAREKFAAQGLSGDFRVGSVLDRTVFQEEFFDLVVDGHCFHCIIGGDREVFLANAYRALKPAGIFHVASMCGEIHDPKIRPLFDPQTRCLVRNGIPVRQIKPPEDILQELEMAGFHILDWEVDPPRDDEDQADLLLNAAKRQSIGPGRFRGKLCESVQGLPGADG